MGSISANRSASSCKMGWLYGNSFLFQQRQSAGRVGLGEFARLNTAHQAVVPTGVLKRPLQGETRIDPGHLLDALQRAGFFRVGGILFPQTDQYLLGEGALIFVASGRGGFPRRRWLARLLQQRMVTPSASSVLMPVNRYPSLRTNAYF